MWLSPAEVAENLAKRAQAKRLSLNLSQKSLSERSGVSLGVLKKFEQQGAVSLGSLLKLALVLDSLEGFEVLFKEKPPESFNSLDELMAQKPRQRGRR